MLNNQPLKPLRMDGRPAQTFICANIAGFTEWTPARVTRKRLVGFLALLITSVLVAHSGLAAPPPGKGNPGGGDSEPPSDPPPVHYRGTWITAGWVTEGGGVRVRDINNLGVAVGTADGRGFYSIGGVALDLNALPATWIDLDASGAEVEGWLAITAAGVNEEGQIVGTAAHTSSYNRVYVLDGVLDGPDGADPQFTLLPAVGDGDNRGRAINDLGVIVGDDPDYSAVVYTPWSGFLPVMLGMPLDTVASINNAGEITGRQGFYAAPTSDGYTPGAFIEVQDRWFYRVNDKGQIAGSRATIGKGKRAVPGGSILRLADGTEETLRQGDLFDVARAINDDDDDADDYGHVAFQNSRYGFVWRNPTEGALPLNDLVIDAELFWGDGRQVMPIAMTQPDAVTGFGLICGTIGGVAPFDSFILVPEVPSE